MKLLDDVRATAEFSPCNTYRYTLTRDWPPSIDTRGRVLWIMLNPSTASTDVDDPTVRRCQKFARTWGYDGITVANLFALRSTDPYALYRHPNPVGPDNDDTILRLLTSPDIALVIAAWGTHGRFCRRDADIVTAAALADRRLHVLGITAEGQPRHPLYLPGHLRPAEWC